MVRENQGHVYALRKMQRQKATARNLAALFHFEQYYFQQLATALMHAQP